jgi:transcriptional regulator with XRE-family HTH domain
MKTKTVAFNGWTFRTLRFHQGMTLADVCAVLEADGHRVSVATLNRWEFGDYDLERGLFESMARSIGANPDALMRPLDFTGILWEDEGAVL